MCKISRQAFLPDKELGNLWERIIHKLDAKNWTGVGFHNRGTEEMEWGEGPQTFLISVRFGVLADWEERRKSVARGLEEILEMEGMGERVIALDLGPSNGAMDLGLNCGN